MAESGRPQDTDATGAQGPGFWVFAGFSIVAIVASAFPAVRTVVLFVITLPVRVVGWIVPGGTLHDDAAQVAAVLGWLGWGLLGILWLPVILAVFAVALKLAPASGSLGAAWASALRGARGLPLRAGAAVVGLAPLAAAIVFVALGRLLPWALSFAAVATLVLLSPLLTRPGGRHPIVALTRLSADVVDYLTGLLGAATRWAALALVLVVATAVTQRYVFGITFTKLAEIIIYLHAAMFMLMAAATLKADGHVRVDVFYGSMAPRAKALVNFIGVYVLLAPMCLVVLIYSGGYVDISWSALGGSGERSGETDGLPLVFLLKTVIPAFATILLAQGASLAARSALILVGEDAGGEAGGAPTHPGA
ncbi:MAG: TRAP transporter small permease subunit [Maricaulaceae bacterium]|jgi:TRAP-type mannitol/chloroaromatic compound transport system permease small subunit